MWVLRLLVVLAVGLATLASALINLHGLSSFLRLPQHTNSKLQRQANVRGPASRRLLNSGRTVAESTEECVKFLQAWMPARDRDSALPDGYLWDHATLAMEARSSFPWASDVPWDVFLNYVLPYASLSEKREEWRGMFMSKLRPLVEGTSDTAEAGALLNQEIWSMFGIKFVPNQTPKTLSVYEVLRAGNASCTGLSIFLVSACRSVGVPSRVVGTPVWNRPEKGNHNWVEVYDSSTGLWRFTGAAEWQGWDKGWFYPEPVKEQTPGSEVHGIFATSWEPEEKGVYVPMVWEPEARYVNGVDVTQRYLTEPATGIV